MKKWFILIAVLLVIGFAVTYIAIPSEIKISTIANARTTRDGSFRVIADKQTWHKWFRNNSNNKNIKAGFLINDDFIYKPDSAGNYNAHVTISYSNNIVNNNISVLQLSSDSIALIWQSVVKTGNNPFKKIEQYFFAVHLKNNIDFVLNNLKTFIEKDKNIYGIDIEKGHIRDSFLITTKQMFKQQPTLQDVYKMIDTLKQYANKYNCIETNVPMLNILHDSDKYRVMVGLPVNKELPTQSNISFVKMTNGNFIITQVKGGLATVQNTLDELQLYFADYNKTSMAITFQYLVTNRLQETDTTKWITKIYAPVL